MRFEDAFLDGMTASMRALEVGHYGDGAGSRRPGGRRVGDTGGHNV
jgi:hypothetical protein